MIGADNNKSFGSNPPHRLFNRHLPIEDIIGAPDRIRTCDLCLRRAALYPAELWVRSQVQIGETGGNCNGKAASAALVLREKFVTQLQRVDQNIHLLHGVIKPE